jgi:hypothetical protein
MFSKIVIYFSCHGLANFDIKSISVRVFQERVAWPLLYPEALPSGMNKLAFQAGRGERPVSWCECVGIWHKTVKFVAKRD